MRDGFISVACGTPKLRLADCRYNAEQTFAMMRAAEKAGVKEGDKPEDICDGLIAAMQEIEITGVTGTMTWAANGEVSKTPTAVIIENGVYVGFGS